MRRIAAPTPLAIPEIPAGHLKSAGAPRAFAGNLFSGYLGPCRTVFASDGDSDAA